MSFDSSERLIDDARDSQRFFIKMTKIGKLGSVTVSPRLTVNGATTTYTIEIIPNMLIEYGDIFEITFPEEIQLPASYFVQCEGDDSVGVTSCIKYEEHTLRISLTNSDRRYNVADPFFIKVYNCVNPVSFKPTSTFRGMKLTSKMGNEVA